MVIALTYVAVSIGMLGLLTFVYVVEDNKGKRIFLLGLRTKLDRFLTLILQKIERIMFSFTNGFMRLLLHYGAHSVLKRVLALIRRLETKVEELVRQNRKVAKDIGGSIKPKTHLGAIAEHKEEMALTSQQKEDMRAH